ncbi:MAG: energy transducer TonB [Quisquiliibacterium sp.]
MHALPRLRMPRLSPPVAWLCDPLSIGVIVSLLLHALLLALKFTPPEPMRIAPTDSRLEIVLLNAQTRDRPLKAEVLAQVDMSAGGERDTGRAGSPLPALDRVADGVDLREQRRRVEQLEQQQRRLLALAGNTGVAAAQRDPVPDPLTIAPGPDAQDVESAIARLQAQIDRQISDYNKRPKRLTFGVNATGVAYARYVDAWASKIERIGTERYPSQARGKMYDSLIITVEIDKHGNVVDVIINRKSRYAPLNRAVREIVYAGAPYDRFPPEMAREGDILQIVRTWTFTNDSLSTESIRVQ